MFSLWGEAGTGTDDGVRRQRGRLPLHFLPAHRGAIRRVKGPYDRSWPSCSRPPPGEQLANHRDRLGGRQRRPEEEPPHPWLAWTREAQLCEPFSFLLLVEASRSASHSSVSPTHQAHFMNSWIVMTIEHFSLLSAEKRKKEFPPVQSTPGRGRLVF